MEHEQAQSSSTKSKSADTYSTRALIIVILNKYIEYKEHRFTASLHSNYQTSACVSLLVIYPHNYLI